MKRIAFFVGASTSTNHSNTDSTNGGSLGRGYDFVHPMDDGGSVQETCLKIIIIFVHPFGHDCDRNSTLQL